MESLSFSQYNRIKNQSTVSAIFNSSDYIVKNKSVLILAKRSQRSYCRLVVICGKKNIRHAVDRNRAKRIVRETFRHFKNCQNHTYHQEALDIVVLLKKPFMFHLDDGTAYLDELWRALNKKFKNV